MYCSHECWSILTADGPVFEHVGNPAPKTWQELRLCGRVSSVEMLTVRIPIPRHIVDDFGYLSSLAELGLSQTGLRELPAEIMRLTALRCLYANRNMLTEIPQWILKMGNLRSVQLEHNLITVAPACARRDILIILSDNPLVSVHCRSVCDEIYLLTYDISDIACGHLQLYNDLLSQPRDEMYPETRLALEYLEHVRFCVIECDYVQSNTIEIR